MYICVVFHLGDIVSAPDCLDLETHSETDSIARCCQVLFADLEIA
jgi:hypothetical protein